MNSRKGRTSHDRTSHDRTWHGRTSHGRTWHRGTSHVAREDCRARLLRMARGIEGDLTPAERRALARHLAGCTRCGALAESLRRTVQVCREAGAPAMSARAATRARANARKHLENLKSQA